MKRPLASFSGLPSASSLALCCTSVRTVPLGIGWPALSGGDGLRRRVELAILLVVGAVDGGVEHAFGVVLGKGDLFAAGAHGDGERDGGQGDGGNDWQSLHGVLLPSLNVPPTAYGVAIDFGSSRLAGLL